jgi:hypothetical protein
MALERRGLFRNESLAIDTATVTASGLEATYTGPTFLYAVTVSEPLRAAYVRVLIADATTSGTAARYTFALSSGVTSDSTQTFTFNPPVYFANGIFTSSTGVNLGSVTYNIWQGIA